MGKVLKIFKNIGVFFLVYLIVFLLCDSFGLVKAPIMEQEFTAKTSELSSLKKDFESLSLESFKQEIVKEIETTKSKITTMSSEKETLTSAISEIKGKLK